MDYLAVVLLNNDINKKVTTININVIFIDMQQYSIKNRKDG